MSEITTDRLRLRAWRESDLAPWAAMNADPEVRRYFPDVLTHEQSAASIEHFQRDLDARGWGWWAVETRTDGQFVGFAGLDPVEDGLPISGVEVGWRLARSAWGHGYATEAGRACLAYGFDTLALPEIVAFTTTNNEGSLAVMRRLGMTHDPADDFDDPSWPEGPLRRTVVHRISRPRP
jgi:RimJ/RimL family protein N-acetyltransferase